MTQEFILGVLYLEQFDILDKDGNATGLVASKGSRLGRGQYYLGTHVYIFNSALEFLIQQRTFDKEFLPGGWDVHLEHTVAGETSRQCAIRGLYEEIGLLASEADICFLGRFMWEECSHIIDIYFLKADFDINKLTIEKSEVAGVKAIPKEEMINLVENMFYRPAEYRKLILDEINRK